LTLNQPPVTTTPNSASVITGKTTALTGFSTSDGDADSAGETVTVVLTDTIGVLSATAGTGATVSGAGTKALTLSGSLAGVNAELATLTYKGSLTGTAASANDTLKITTNDSRGASTTASLVVKINHVPPSITAPATLKELSGQTVALSGFSI